MIKNKLFLYCLFSFSFFFSILYSCSVLGRPLLATKTALWNEKNIIYIANCVKPSASIPIPIQILKPPSETDQSFIFLDMTVVSEKERQYIYAVSSEREKSASVLYRFESGKATPVSSYPLPFGLTDAALRTKEIKVGDRISNILVLIGNNDKLKNAKDPLNANNANSNQTCYATLFDITSHSDFLKPMTHFENGIQDKLKNLTQAQLIRTPKEGWTVLLSGQIGQAHADQSQQGTTGALRFVFLEQATTPLTLTTDRHRMMTVFALDTYQARKADLILAWDEGGGVWELSLENIFQNKPKKIAQTARIVTAGDMLTTGCFHNPHSLMSIVKHLEQPGITAYFVGQDRDAKPLLFRLDRTADGKTEIKTITLLQSMSALFSRFGRLILVPVYFNASANTGASAVPIVLDLTRRGEKPLNIPWVNIFTQDKNESLLANERLCALTVVKCLWDPKHQKEVLVSLNQNCGLSILSAPVTQDKYGRVLWRNMN